MAKQLVFLDGGYLLVSDIDNRWTDNIDDCLKAVLKGTAENMPKIKEILHVETSTQIDRSVASFVSFKDESGTIQNTRSFSLKKTHPRLNTWLEKQPRTSPVRVSLGRRGEYFASSSQGYRWGSVTEDFDEEMQSLIGSEGGWQPDRKPTDVCFGGNGSFLIKFEGGKHAIWSENFKTCYKDLYDHLLKQLRDKEDTCGYKYISINPYRVNEWVVVWNDNTVEYSLPPSFSEFLFGKQPPPAPSPAPSPAAAAAKGTRTNPRLIPIYAPDDPLPYRADTAPRNPSRFFRPDPVRHQAGRDPPSARSSIAAYTAQNSKPAARFAPVPNPPVLYPSYPAKPSVPTLQMLRPASTAGTSVGGGRPSTFTGAGGVPAPRWGVPQQSSMQQVQQVMQGLVLAGKVVGAATGNGGGGGAGLVGALANGGAGAGAAAGVPVTGVAFADVDPSSMMAGTGLDPVSLMSSTGLDPVSVMSSTGLDPVSVMSAAGLDPVSLSVNGVATIAQCSLM